MVLSHIHLKFVFVAEFLQLMRDGFFLVTVYTQVKQLLPTFIHVYCIMRFACLFFGLVNFVTLIFLFEKILQYPILSNLCFSLNSSLKQYPFPTFIKHMVVVCVLLVLLMLCVVFSCTQRHFICTLLHQLFTKSLQPQEYTVSGERLKSSCLILKKVVVHCNLGLSQNFLKIVKLDPECFFHFQLSG